MKRIFFLVFIISNLFGLSLEQRVEILEKKVAQLEKQLNIVNNSQKQIIKKEKLKDCNRIKLVDYNYNYNNAGFIQSYDFKYILKNSYPYAIKHISGKVVFKDNENTILLVNYIKSDKTIETNKTIIVKSNYLIDNDLAKYVKDTPKKDLKVKFTPFKIIFTNGQELKCN